MRRVHLFLVLVFLFPVFLVLAVTLAASSWAQITPESSIRQLLLEQAADWNRGDVEAFMKAYENSPDTTFVGQTVQYGYATILQRYKKLYGTPAAMGNLTFPILRYGSWTPVMQPRLGIFI